MIQSGKEPELLSEALAVFESRLKANRHMNLETNLLYHIVFNPYWLDLQPDHSPLQLTLWWLEEI